MDWNKLKKEYIAGGVSYRELASKYNAPFGTLRKVAARDHWRDLRDKARAEADTIIVNEVSNAMSANASKVSEVADKLLTKLSDSIDKISVLDSQSIKHYTSALKDLKDIKGIKSDADMREQEARIDNLRRQAEKGEESKDVTVVIAPEAEGYSE